MCDPHGCLFQLKMSGKLPLVLVASLALVSVVAAHSVEKRQTTVSKSEPHVSCNNDDLIISVWFQMSSPEVRWEGVNFHIFFSMFMFLLRFLKRIAWIGIDAYQIFNELFFQLWSMCKAAFHKCITLFIIFTYRIKEISLLIKFISSSFFNQTFSLSFISSITQTVIQGCNRLFLYSFPITKDTSSSLCL